MIRYITYHDKGGLPVPMTPTEMIQLLKQHGFVYVKSNNGSHQKYRNAARNITVVVPVHAKELHKGLEQKLLKEAGLK